MALSSREGPETKPAPKAEAEPKAIPTPEGKDEAIFQQGVKEARQDKNSGLPPHTNPFQEGTHQAEAWQAGYAAGGS
jgi:hypothetical protein